MSQKFLARVGLPVLLAFVAASVWQFLTIRDLKNELAAIGRTPAGFAAPRPVASQSAQEVAKAVPSFAEDKRFSLPIDCSPGRDCWVPNYVDAQPGKGARDYAGGVRTYENHKGVDFAIRDQRAMITGVTVRAAAGGVVRAIRDAMADVDYKLLKPETIKGRECGNAVVVQHDPDWRTQYCHMRAGSVAVGKGQRIKAHAALGLVGMSGKTEFPHLHFMIFFKGKPVDPFTGFTVNDGTKVAGRLWRDEARALLQYRETNIYHAGFAAETPKYQAARRGEYNGAWLISPVKDLFVWMDIFGVHDGDRVIVKVIGPGGREVAVRRLNLKLKRPRARQFLQIGFKHEGEGWPAGTYESQVALARLVGHDNKIFRATRRVTIN